MIYRYRIAVPRRLRIALLIPVSLQVIGTVGYPLIEGDPWTLFDGAYMTAITLATIGYGETHPLTTSGRVFTILLAYSGIFTLAYFAGEVVRSVVTGELREMLRKERMERELAKLSRHIIVCGYGRMGRIVCDELEHQHVPFVVIDKQAMSVANWRYEWGVKFNGDAAEDVTLRRAGIEQAVALIAVVGSDADNLYITLSARLLNPTLKIISRAEEQDAEAKLRKVGADNVISPYLAGGHRAVQAALRPTALPFMEMATRSDILGLEIEEIIIEPGSSLESQSIHDAKIHERYGVLLIGLKRPDQSLRTNPGGHEILSAGSTVIALGPPLQLTALENLARRTPPTSPKG
jgi:voltage-gated potassium channel